MLITWQFERMSCMKVVGEVGVVSGSVGRAGVLGMNEAKPY